MGKISTSFRYLAGDVAFFLGKNGAAENFWACAAIDTVKEGLKPFKHVSWRDGDKVLVPIEGIFVNPKTIMPSTVAFLEKEMKEIQKSINKGSRYTHSYVFSGHQLPNGSPSLAKPHIDLTLMVD